VFEEVTRRKDRRPAARRGAFVALSAVAEAGLLLALLALAARFRSPMQREEPLLPIQIVRSAASVSPPPAPPPPPPPRKASPKVQARKPPVTRPPSEVAMVQPRSVPTEPHPSPPEEPVGPPPAESKEEEATSGGVAGGEPGGVVGGAVGWPREGGVPVEEVPAYATAGYRRPELAQSGCLQGALSIPRDLRRSLSGPVTVKFAIGKDGTPTSFQVMGQLEDGRIADIIWKAVTSCRWVPGADPKGKPASIWVVVPFRFESK